MCLCFISKSRDKEFVSIFETVKTQDYKIMHRVTLCKKTFFFRKHACVAIMLFNTRAK